MRFKKYIISLSLFLSFTIYPMQDDKYEEFKRIMDSASQSMEKAIKESNASKVAQLIIYVENFAGKVCNLKKFNMIFKFPDAEFAVAVDREIKLLRRQIVKKLNKQLNDAVQSNDYNAIKEIVAQGADVNNKTYYGRTPLMSAAFLGHFEAVNILLEFKNIDVDAVTKLGLNVLHYAVWACDNNNIEIRKLILGILLNHVKDINVKSNKKWTPAHVAASRGNLWALIILAGCGADLTLKNEDNKNVLSIAQSNNQKEIVEYLQNL